MCMMWRGESRDLVSCQTTFDDGSRKRGYIKRQLCHKGCFLPFCLLFVELRVHICALYEPLS